MQSKASDRYLLWIAIYKFVKGSLFLAISIGVLGLLHRDVQEIAENFVTWLRADPENRYISLLLEKADLITDLRIKQLSGFTFLCSGLFLTEGAGLYFKKKWAEYLTCIATGSLIPVEIYEVATGFGPLKLSVLVGNTLIFSYLVFVLRKRLKEEKAAADNVKF